MGRASRPKPTRLAEKLLEIRTRLELSQNGILRRMGIDDNLTREEVSAFERGIRFPHYLSCSSILEWLEFV